MGVGYCTNGGPKNKSHKIVIPWDPLEIPESWCSQGRHFCATDDFYGETRRCKQCDNAYRARKYRQKAKRKDVVEEILKGESP